MSLPCSVPKFRVGICGGGIAGLATALALAKQKIASTVYERDVSVDARRQGYGLTIQQGMRAIKYLDLADDIQTFAVSKSHFVFTSEGKPIAFWGPSISSDNVFAVSEKKTLRELIERGESFFIHLPRQTLRKALLSACLRYPEFVCIEWGKNVTHFTKETDQLRVHFTSASAAKSTPENPTNENASSASSYLTSNSNSNISSPCSLSSSSSSPLDASSSDCVSCVVGTDGIRSVVRESLPPLPSSLVLPHNTKPDRAEQIKEMFEQALTHSPAGRLRYLGMMVILGICNTVSTNKISHNTNSANNWSLFEDRVFQTSDGNSRLFVMPFQPEQHMWQLTFRCEENHAQILMKSPMDLLREVRERCRDWHMPIPLLLKETSEADVTGYPMYDSLPFTSCSQEAMLLLGDAAHPMSPLQGQGANQALLDAVLFAEALSALEPNKHSSSLQPRLIATVRSLEKRITERNVPKVLTSRRQCDVLHHPNFLDPVFQTKRKSLSGVVERVQAMTKADITVHDAQRGWLDMFAFGKIPSAIN